MHAYAAQPPCVEPDFVRVVPLQTDADRDPLPRQGVREISFCLGQPVAFLSPASVQMVGGDYGNAGKEINRNPVQYAFFDGSESRQIFPGPDNVLFRTSAVISQQGGRQ